MAQVNFFFREKIELIDFFEGNNQMEIDTASCTWTLEHLGCAGAAGTRDIPARDEPQTGADSLKHPHLGNERSGVQAQARCLKGDWAFAAILPLQTMAYLTLNGIFFLQS